jgi:hypothetical protein
MLTLANKSTSIAQFIVYKGQQIICKLPGVAPGGSVGIPTDDTYEVYATTTFKGNLYTSAPVSVDGSMVFTARVRQSRAEGSYSFVLETSPSAAADTLQFEKTCLNPVTFTILKDSVPLQSIVVKDTFTDISLDITETYSVYAVCEGITTDTVVTSNPQATLTLTASNSWLESGYATFSAA